MNLEKQDKVVLQWFDPYAFTHIANNMHIFPIVLCGNDLLLVAFLGKIKTRSVSNTRGRSWETVDYWEEILKNYSIVDGWSRFFEMTSRRYPGLEYSIGTPGVVSLLSRNLWNTDQDTMYMRRAYNLRLLFYVPLSLNKLIEQEWSANFRLWDGDERISDPEEVFLRWRKMIPPSSIYFSPDMEENLDDGGEW